MLYFKDVATLLGCLNLIALVFIFCFLSLYFFKNRIALSILSIFFIYLVSLTLGLRGEFSGVDTHGYVEFYRSLLVRPKEVIDEFEIGFYYFSIAMSILDSPEAYIFLITAFQLLFIYISIWLVGCRNSILPLVLYVAFVPGLDMLTNGIRGGLALSLAFFLIITSLRYNILKRTSSLLACSIHYSILIVFVAQFFSIFKFKYKTLFRLNLLVVFFFSFWLIVDISHLTSFLTEYTKGYSVLSKFVRYLVIEKKLMDDSVKLYFILVSVLLSSIIFYLSSKTSNIKNDETFISLLSITTFLTLLYAVISFSEYSFRFMFLAYPFQILLISYLSERTKKTMKIQVCLLSLATFMSIITYSTKTFNSFELFQIF